MQELNVKYLNYDHHSHTIGVVLLELGSYVLNLIVTANLHIKVKGVATARFGGPNQTPLKKKKKKKREEKRYRPIFFYHFESKRTEQRKVIFL